MSRNLSFEQIKERVAAQLEPFNQIDHDYLNERGMLIFEVYDELDDCLLFASNLTEFVKEVHREIQDLLKTDWSRKSDIEDKYTKIADRLRKFVRCNVEESLWKDIPEFANREEEK